MLSTTSIGGNSSALQGGMSGAGGGPETGGFDFMSQLLGLQGSTLDLIQTEPENLMLERPGKGEGQDDPFAGLFDKKEAPEWNQIFPGGNGLPVQVSNVSETGEVDASALTEKTSAKWGSAETKQTTGLGESTKTENQPVPKELENSQSTDDFLKLHSELQANVSAGSPKVDVAVQKYNKQDFEEKLNAENQDSSKTSQKAMFSGADQTRAFENLKPESLSETSEFKASDEQSELESLETRSSGEKQNENLVTLSTNVTSTKAITEGLNETSKSEVRSHSIPEVFEKVESMVNHGGGKMTVSLTPEHLGRVEIQVTTRGKNVEISVMSENETTKNAIESKLGDLRQSMQVQDLHLSKMEVQVSREGFKADMDSSQMGQFNQPNMQNSFRDSSGFSKGSQGQNPWRNQDGIPTAALSRTGFGSSASSIPRSFAQGSGRVDIRI